MANPQKEKGYTAISNEIIEKLAQLNLSGSEFRCVIVLIRKTYGFHKKEDFLSLTQWEKFTKLSRPTVIKVLKNLMFKNIFVKNDNKYRLNKNWEEWGSKSVFTSKGAFASKSVFTIASKSVFTIASKSVFTHKRNLLKKLIKETDNEVLLDDNLLKNMYNYCSVDEDGNPIEKKKKVKITKEQNHKLIQASLLWRKMCAEYLSLPESDVVMKNIYFPIRALFNREGYNIKDYEGLYKYFLSDKNIKQDNKMSFDLMMSEKYVAKYKIAKRSNDEKVSNYKIAEQIKL